MKTFNMNTLADLGVLEEVAKMFERELSRAFKDIKDAPLVDKPRKVVLEIELNPSKMTAVVKCQAKTPAKQSREWKLSADKQGLLFIDDDLK